MTSDTIFCMARVEADRKELMDGLNYLAKIIKPKTATEAILRFEDRRLFIRIGAGEISVTANGRWPGEARVPALFMFAVAKHAPPVEQRKLMTKRSRMQRGWVHLLC